ncbi:MAG: hypothetical protein V7683_02125 [Pseudoalteromonas distincta]|tara:strand:- start:7318 stop:7443 length:126 start_codon:yes stop_codon:yes gene_type:complete
MISLILANVDPLWVVFGIVACAALGMLILWFGSVDTGKLEE